MSPGSTLHVDGCAISGFSSPGNAGILFQAAGKLEVKDSIFRNNGAGIAVEPSSRSALATIDHVRLERNISGVVALDGSTVTVSNSVASANNTGFAAGSGSTASAEINVESCVASNNAVSGVEVDSTSTGVATARVSNTTVTDNGIGLNNSTGSPAVLLSRTNNTVEGNGTNVVGTISSYLAK